MVDADDGHIILLQQVNPPTTILNDSDIPLVGQSMTTGRVAPILKLLSEAMSRAIIPARLPDWEDMR